MPLLQLANVTKSFVAPDGSTQRIIDIPSFALEEKQQLALVGESGSGKSTLLHLIAGILRADSGSVTLAGQDISKMSESARDRWRALNVGYVYQSFNLLPAFTCLENILLGMAFGTRASREEASKLLARVGLSHRLDHYPRQLSSGQQQRVAIARALANRPKLILADEPTGNLDHANAVEVLTLIRATCTENGAALLLVSHDPDVIGQFDSVTELRALNRAATPQNVP